MEVVGDDLTEEDVIDYANNVWYYDMKDEDEEEIEDFDVAVDYLEQNEEFSVQRKLPQLLKKKIKRSRKK
jgi:DNA/RNA endonuclease G (NUC1)